MISNKDILNTYYDDAEEEVFPGFFDSEDVEAKLIPGYEDEYTIYSIHRVKPEYAELLSGDGYGIVYRILGRGKDFIGQYVGRELYDVGDDIARIVDEDSEPELTSFDQPEKVAYGEELYNSYGPDVDPNDLDEYDAECYLAYKKSIGE